MKYSYINKIFTGLFVVVVLSSCFKDKNSPGYEYMPDMYRSPAIEAYIDYGEVRTWIPNDSLKNRLTALRPPDGTIPYTGTEDIWLPYHRKPSKALVEQNGIISRHTSETDYDESVNDLSPIAFNYENVTKGKIYYERFCDHCHGDKGNGEGYFNDALGAQPADLTKKWEEGKMFYSITYGKGVMGSHASQLTQKERWELIQYLKVLGGAEMPEEQLSLKDQFLEEIKHLDEEGDHKVSLNSLVFSSGSALLNKEESRETLDVLLDFMKTQPYNIELAGYTDNVGDPEMNEKLSEMRAKAVKDYLVENGVEEGRVDANGYGESNPVASNMQASGRALNRRTEVIIK